MRVLSQKGLLAVHRALHRRDGKIRKMDEPIDLWKEYSKKLKEAKLHCDYYLQMSSSFSGFSLIRSIV